MNAKLQILSDLSAPGDQDRPPKLVEAEKELAGLHAKWNRLWWKLQAAKAASRAAETAANWEATWKAAESARFESECCESGLSIWGQTVDKLRWQWHRDTVLAAVEEALKTTPRRQNRAAK